MLEVLTQKVGRSHFELGGNDPQMTLLILAPGGTHGLSSLLSRNCPLCCYFPSFFISIYNSVGQIHINHISWWYLHIFPLHYFWLRESNCSLVNEFLKESQVRKQYPILIWLLSKSSLVLRRHHQFIISSLSVMTVWPQRSHPLRFILSQWYFKAWRQSVESMFPMESSYSTILFVQRTGKLWNLSRWQQSSTMQCGAPYKPRDG